MEALYRRGQYAALVGEYERQGQDSPWEDALEAAQAHYYVAMAYYRLGQIASVQRMVQALEEVHGTQDRAWIGKVRYQAGEVFRRAGDTGAAQHWTELFLADLEMYPEHEPFRGPAHYQLGLILRMRRDVAGSIREYRAAVEILQDEGRSGRLVMALDNLCWVLLEDGQVRMAAEALERSETALLALDESPESNGIRLTHLYVMAFALLHQGKAVEAARLCEEVLMDESGATSDQQALAAWVAAECGIALGQPDHAKTLLEIANKFAIKAQDARVMNYVVDSRRKLASGDGWSA